MAEKRGFDLAALLGSVPDLSAGGPEQIELLPWDKLLPDDRNFYSLEGLGELADSIATVGLLDPIRVRRDGDVYVIISGHRRRAAIKLLIDSGEERWKTGVPCIVERGEITAELAELKLIYANSATRQLSASELSRQAERVEELLYKLKEQGFPFPGRMQAHVAEACGTTESKLKRLHAIRNNLDPTLLGFFDCGELLEDAAYKLSRLPEEIQAALGRRLSDGKKHRMPSGTVVGTVLLNLEGLRKKPLTCPAHAGATPCHNAEDRIVRSLLQSSEWMICSQGQCCLECSRRSSGSCPGECREARDRTKLEKDVKAEEKEKRQEAADRRNRELEARIRRRAQELLPYAEKAGLAADAQIFAANNAATVSDLRRYAAGDFGDRFFYSDECVRPALAQYAVAMAKRLGCSLELACGLPEKKTEAPPAGAPVPGWQTGTPTRAGRYFASILIRDTRHGDLVSEHRADWDGECWWLYQQKLLPGYEVVGWWPLPEKISEEAIEE